MTATLQNINNTKLQCIILLIIIDHIIEFKQNILIQTSLFIETRRLEVIPLGSACSS